MSESIDVRFGQHLRRLREQRGWSLTEMARRYGGSRSMLYQIERGESSPSLGMLEKLATAFGLTLPALLAMDGEDAAVEAEWAAAFDEAIQQSAALGAALARWENAVDDLRRIGAKRQGRSA